MKLLYSIYCRRSDFADKASMTFIKLCRPDPNLNSYTDRHVGELLLTYSPFNNHPLQLPLLLLTMSFPDDIIALLFFANKSRKSMLFEY